MPIKNFGAGTPRFNEGIVITGSDVSALQVYQDASSVYAAVIDNDAGSAGHGLKVTTDGTGTGTNILDLEAGSTTVFKVRGDGRVGIGVDTPGSTLSVDDEIAVGEKLVHRGDPNTYLQFPSNDNITFAAGGSEELKIASDAILVKQYIKHDGDEDTLINFADDKIILKAGNIAMVTAEQKDSAPHEVTINDGSNNIDLVVKGNGSGAGNPGMKFDASTNRLGINGVGTPDEALHVWGNIKVDGTEPTIVFNESGADRAVIGVNSSDNILIENKTMNKHIVFKVNDQGVVREGLRLDGAVAEVVVNQSAESLVDFRVESDNKTHALFVDGSSEKVFVLSGSGVTGGDGLDVNFFVSGSTNSKGTATAGTAVFGGDTAVSGNLYVVDTGGLYADKIRRYSDSDNTTKILLNDELLKFYAGHSSNDIVRIGETNYGDDNNFWVSGSIGSKGTATRGVAVFGGDLIVSGGLDVDGMTLVVDESTNMVGVGTGSPKTILDVHHNPTSLSNDTGGGEVVTFGTGNLTAGKLYFLNSSGAWTETDADSITTSDGLLGIALGAAPSDGVLLRGFFDATTYLSNFVSGLPVYLSTTAASMDTTAPSGASDIVRCVGYCTNTANVIYFNPESTTLELS